MISINLMLVVILTLNKIVKTESKLCIEESELKNDVLERSKRQLLFPNTTLLQLNIGVGSATPIKTINVNWAFQANFQLPWNRSQIPVDIFFANSGYDGDSRRAERDVEEEINKDKEIEKKYDGEGRLYHLYKYIEDTLFEFGHNGTLCVLQTLCQLAAEPLHVDDDDDLLHELARYVLNPNNDQDLDGSEDFKIYVDAYNRGNVHKSCSNYEKCSLNLVDMITEVHTMEFDDGGNK